MEVKDIDFTSGNGISNVSFSFFNSERIRKTSVKQITRSATFDRIGQPQPNGLYDPSLGPVDPMEHCKTCAQSYDDCPGHYGHIELALPVFHPLLFNELYKLLRCCCFSCRVLKMGAERKAYFVHILSLIRRGKLALAGNALAYEDGYLDLDIDEDEDVLETYDVRDKFKNKTAHQQEMWAEAIAACMGAMPNKCAHCGNVACSLKKDGYSRILKKPLTKRQRAQGSKKSPAASKMTPSKKAGASDSDEDESPSKTKAKKSKAKNHEVSDSSESDDEGSGDEDADVMDSDVREKDGDLQEDGLSANVTAQKALELLQHVFKRDSELLGLIFGSEFSGQLKGEASIFFLQTLLISPNRFRPPVQLGEQQFEHPINAALKAIMLDNDEILAMTKDNKQDAEKLAEDESVVDMDKNQLMKRWHNMQVSVNTMIDSTKGEKKEKDLSKGVRQDLERKEGLMRMNMMGKRVNFACRSVISPDPFMTTAEVGIPEVFAKRLSWPEPVNQYNVRRLRQALINGPDVWPGANYIIDEKGNKVDLSKMNQQKRNALAKQLERKDTRGLNWKVGRHLVHGDFVLVNRQPTLHKVSLMAHKVRVNKGQRVIRMHYANCKSYNADFDGDEINVHFPQDQLGRAEAATIVQNDLQYIVPTDGSPIRGLIQDHVIAGVQICQINRTFTKEEYSELVFLMLTGLAADLGLPENRILTVPPAFIKPIRRWTGKQIITTILINLLHDCPPLNNESSCKVKGVMVGQHKHEERVVVRGNDFLTGCLDKNQIGSSAEGIVHSVFESYGANKAGLLLTIFGRLFTHFQQVHRAFTCGVYDLMVTDEGNARRREILATANRRTLDSSANFAELDFDDDKKDKEKNGKLDAKELDRRRRLVHSALAHKLHEEKGRKLNDSRIMQSLAPVTSGVIDAILPNGQMVAFPENNFEMMTGTGAKGSKVNMSQICCLLGQQQLEGQRVPVMASGKTLPCFQALETDARAGGYIADRFLTGIRPQEYFFHCMSGREGLVDTAVKTSRSGYLQRCLVKHLESLTVAYDRTVRDNDGGIHQFLYGEDGIDPVKQLGLKWLSHLADNSAATLKTIHESTLDKMDRKAVKEHQKQVRKIAKSKGVSYQEARKELPPLTNLGYADTHLGFVSENFEDYVDSYIAKYKDLPSSPSLLRGGGDAAFKQLAYFKYAKAMAQPGEPVGATAAQSVGEPSTQMTLNTFHSAGQGNATAGIPRLRELIMTASKKPANPQMTLSLDRSKIDSVAKSKDLAENIAQQLSRVCVVEFVNSVEVADTIVAVSSDVGYMREYKLQVFTEPENMLTAKLRKCTAALAALPSILESTFTLQILGNMEKELAKDGKGKGLEIIAGAAGRGGKDEEEEGEEKKKGAESSGESSNEDDDESEDDGDAKRGHKKSEKGFSEADKADKKAVKKGSKAAAAAKVALKDADDDVMDEEEVVEGAGSITLIKMTARESDKLCSAKDRYHVKTSYKAEGKGGKGVFEMTVRVSATRKRIMMVALIESVAEKCVVQELPGILYTHVIDPPKKEGSDKNYSIMTEGANLDLFTLWQVNRQKNVNGALDLSRVSCNDISQIRRVLGVEAARKTLFDEIGGIFSAYGIGVDARHISLISDSMMYSGEHRPMNRIGMKHSASPLLKMSFETTCTFLVDATAVGDSDNLDSPSARLILGRPVKAGTGFFDLRLQLAAAQGS